MKITACPKYLLLTVVALSLLWSDGAAAEVQVRYQHKLANFSGPVLYHWPRLAVDPGSREVYAVSPRGDEIKVFNEHGMEVHDFGSSSNLQGIRDLAVLENGDILMLTAPSGGPALVRRNYRGELLEEIALSGLPAAFSDFTPRMLAYRRQRLYLLDPQELKVVIADTAGVFEKGYPLRRLLEREAGSDPELRKKLKSIDFAGFDVDRHGTMYFTVPASALVYRLTPEGELQGFGAAGSAPGKFGVVAGIAADADGNIYVSDRLRCVVLVFSPRLEFLSEFGYRGDRPENLVVPNDLALDDDGNLYIAQAGGRGVSVFKIVSVPKTLRWEKKR